MKGSSVHESNLSTSPDSRPGSPSRRLLSIGRIALTFASLLLVSCALACARTWKVASFAGPDASAKINAAVRAASPGDKLDLSGFTGTQTLAEQVLIDKPLTLVNCSAQFVETMPDPGIQSNGGGINIDADANIAAKRRRNKAHGVSRGCQAA
ncbi:MAG TPA: hypothetical protein VMT67_17170 [Terriglobales bacterium]|nr:hypothetical protein [Terriglobales bacterium]